MTEIVPKTIAAGVNFSASAWRSEYSGAEWSLILLLRGPAVIDLHADRDGARHVWDVVGTQTAEWKPGEYAYAVRASNGSDVIDIETGRLRIRPDLAAAVEGYDGRSEYRKALDAIEAVLAKRATLDQDRYRINNRELYRTSPAELIRLRAHYVELVRREEMKAKGGRLFGRQVKFVMGQVR